VIYSVLWRTYGLNCKKKDEELQTKDQEMQVKDEKLAKETQAKKVCRISIFFANLYMSKYTSLLTQKLATDLAMEKANSNGRENQLESELAYARQTNAELQRNLW
jgi:hypothetical protein